MKTLVVFYSLTGNTKKIALAVASAAGAQILEIRLKKELPGNKFFKYFFAGLQAVKKESPEIMPLGKNPNDYDLIFLGSPVWGPAFAPAIRSFLGQAKLQNKKIALFCSCGGEDPGDTLENTEKELAGNKIAGKISFKMNTISEARLADNFQKAAEWARGIANK